MRIFLLLFILSSLVAEAQNKTWQIEPMLIFSNHFSKRTPIRNTPIGYVKAPPAITLRDVGLNLKYHYKQNRAFGIRFFNQEFQYGFRPTNNGAGAGLSVATGMTWSRFQKRIMQWNLEFYSEIRKKITQKNTITTYGSFQLGWLPYSSVYLDTNRLWPTLYNGDSLVYEGQNDTERSSFIPTKYIKHPAFQNNNLRVQLGIGVGWEHKINKRMGYGFNLNYRQGFNPLFIDGTEIFVDYFTNPRSQLFKTKITGTGMQWCNRFIIYI